MPNIQSAIHVQINNSKYLQKSVLESALSSNKLQQSTLRIRELQISKRKRLLELRNLIKELSESAKTLHLKEFPQFRDKEEKKEITREKKEKTIITPSRSYEEESLMKELNDIKAKLDSISI
ncbi:hypothetical protein HYV88_02015 [Candidatus Woesearchaeota archaeon]|nr:hypothetical protein [Candidatus Woesearchaeota archaeon]